MLTDKTAGSPAQRRHEKTRREILTAAHTLIKKEGMEGFTMRALADAMDYTPAALYKYFHDKGAILEELRQEGWRLLRAMHANAAQTPLGTPELLRALGRTYQDFATRYPEYYLLMFASTDAAPHTLDEIKARPDFQRIVTLLQAGIDDGSFRLPPGTNVVQLRFLIWFASHGMAMLKLTWLRECGAEMEIVGQEAMDALVALMTWQPE